MERIQQLAAQLQSTGLSAADSRDVASLMVYTHGVSGDTYARVNVNSNAPTSGGRPAVQFVGGRHIVVVAGTRAAN